jgi:uncharacterized protein
MKVATGLIPKVERAISVLRAHRGVTVALSGGVDSATLLAIACQALGSANVRAVTGRSSSVTERELEDAKRVAGDLGVIHSVVDTHEIERADYRANRGDRCFHCRTELFEVLSAISAGTGFEAIAYGAIVDDLGDDRPGMDAAREKGILAPLLEAGICKTDVRTLAKQLQLHIHDKPSNACLASRIPTGSEVTVERLTQIALAERGLGNLGFRQFRVRHHGDIARIELSNEDAGRLADSALRAEMVQVVKSAGFRFVTVDLQGYGSGRLYSIVPARESGQ